MSDPCIICGSTEQEALYTVRDYEHGVPGEWTLGRCKKCGLMLHMPMPSGPEVATFYPPSYSAYSGDSPINWMFTMVYALDARRVARWIGKSGRILDVGCGSGAAIEALKKRGEWDIWGLEFDAGAVAKAQAAGLNVQCGDLLTADLPKGSFDLVHMGHLIEHVLDPVATLKRAFELLKPGGILVGETPNTDCWDARLFGRYWGGLHPPRHLYLFSWKNFTEACQKVGFGRVETLKRFRPVGWSASVQNYLSDRGWIKVPEHGRVNWYILLVLPGVALTALQILLGSRPGTMAFVAHKPAAGG